MNISKIEEITNRGLQLKRQYFAYGTVDSVTTVRADKVEELIKELAIKLKDKENPLVLTMFFYFDNMDFTGMGGEI